MADHGRTETPPHGAAQAPDDAARMRRALLSLVEDQKRAAERLREAQAQLESILANVGEMVWSLDVASGRLLYVSRAVEAIYGRTPADFIGRPELRVDLAHPDDAPTVKEKDRKLRESGAASAEYRIVRPDGSMRWVLDKTVLVCDAAGRPLRVESSVSDITERKVAETALRQSEEVLRLFVEHAPAAIAMFDSEMRYVAYSRRWLRDYGLGERDLGGHSHYEIFPDLPERWKAVHRAALGGASAQCDDDPFPRADGTTDWVRWEARPWHRDGGEVGGIVIFSEVVTARKRAELALEESEARYRSLFENDHTAMLIVDPANGGEIVDANPAAVRFYGWSRNELRAMQIGQINALSPEEVEAEMRRAAVRERAHFEFRHRRASGDIRDVDVYSGPITVEGKSLLYSIVHDVTERRAVEARVALLARRAQSLVDLPATAEKLDDRSLMQHGQEVAEMLTGSRIAFIHLVNEDHETIELVAWSKRAPAEFCTAAFDSRYPIGQAGIWTDAFRRRAPVVFNDCAAHPDMRGLPPGQARLDRLVSVPVVEGGKVRMITGVGNKADDYTATDVETVQLLSDAVWRLVRRRRDAAALAASESRYREIVERATDMIFINRGDRIHYINPAGVALLGAKSGEAIVGRSIFDIFDPEVHDLVRGRIAALRAAVGTEVDVQSEKLIAMDGMRVEVDVKAVSYMAEGNLDIQVTCHDVTERRRAERDARRYVEQLQAALMRTVEVATTISEMRDPYTAGHERRVAQIAIAIGAALGMDAHGREGLRVAGYLHDIGKITIPSEILAKPTRLTDAEMQLVRGHPEAGYDVVKHVDFPWPVAEAIYQHHERIDGSGYPRRLKGDEIILEARILAVADVVEAMASHRPYRPGLGIDRALGEIERGRGTAYDPRVADACLKLFREEGFVLPE